MRTALDEAIPKPVTVVGAYTRLTVERRRRASNIRFLLGGALILLRYRATTVDFVCFTDRRNMTVLSPAPPPSQSTYSIFLNNHCLSKYRYEEERQLLARQRYLQEKKRMIILDESRAEEQARKEAGLARIEQVADKL